MSKHIDIAPAHASVLDALDRLDPQVILKDTNPKDAIGMSKIPLGSVLSAQVTGEAALGMLEGALKYRRHNYRIAGVRASVYYDALKRHMDGWWEGQDDDPFAAIPIHHVSKSISDLYVLRDAMLQGKFVDDRPPRVKNQNWIEDLNARAVTLIGKFRDKPLMEPYTIADTPRE
jgi:hypothetical protein